MLPSDRFFAWLWPATRWVFLEVMYMDTFLRRTSIVTPTWEDFPVDESLEGDELVADYFAFVEEHAGTGAHFSFVALPHMAPLVPDPFLELEPDMPLPIDYASGLERDPEQLVVVLSRGIAHWVCTTSSEPPPGDSFNFAVDLVWTFIGFGVFAANSRSCFGLGRRELTYCLALSLELLGLDGREAREHLQPKARRWLAAAREDLQTRHAREVAALLALKTPGQGPYRS